MNTKEHLMDYADEMDEKTDIRKRLGNITFSVSDIYQRPVFMQKLLSDMTILSAIQCANTSSVTYFGMSQHFELTEASMSATSPHYEMGVEQKLDGDNGMVYKYTCKKVFDVLSPTTAIH